MVVFFGASPNVFATSIFILKSFFSQQEVIMAKTRGKSNRKSRRGRKPTKWTLFVKRIYDEMKRADKDVKLGDAMKEASRRKSEM